MRRIIHQAAAIAQAAALLLLAAPCLLAFNGENPATGDFNSLVNLAGIAYGIFFYRKVLKPCFGHWVEEDRGEEFK